MAGDQGMAPRTIKGRQHNVTPEQFRKAQELFLRAVEIESSERSAWLDKYCHGDDTLRKNVQSLLANDNAQTLLSIDPVEPTEPALVLANVNGTTTSAQRWSLVRALPPPGMMAIGALLVLLPVLLYGTIANRIINQFRNGMRATSLTELVDAKAAAIRFWLAREQTIAQSWADSTKVRELVAELIEVANQASPDDLPEALRLAQQQAQLSEEMTVLADRPVRYAVWDTRLITVADWSPERLGVGEGVTPRGAERLTAVLQGKVNAFVIGPEDAITREYSEMPTKPILGILVPVRGENDRVIAAMLVYNFGAEEELGEFISLTPDPTSKHATAGIFVFDRSGLLLYDSPYDEQLRQLGLIPDHPESHSGKQLILRDPGIDLTKGKPATEPIAAQPQTKMVRMTVGQGAGFDVDGYRDVRGVLVAGAWRWLDDYQFGIGIEVDKRALEPAMWIVQFQYWVMLGLLLGSLCVIGFSIFTIHRLRKQLRSDHRIGPYVLEKMVGEGGMGRVFKARHDFLKRPTAIKLLRPEVTDAQTTARFQREAQLAARLEHPNTVSVYDFGVSGAGICYLVMEWVDGLTLDGMVDRDGPFTIERTVPILRQIAMSLRESHSLGLIHRDLKPQNVMVTSRACESDVVKVLDFGLARDLFNKNVTLQTAEGMVAGTPRYMAPERWDPSQPTGPATDIYAFGCIAFYLLTGRHAIQGDTLQEICARTLSPRRVAPSSILGDTIPEWLDKLIVKCIDPDPAKRPTSFDEILEQLT
jgi:tRNA A-37 threonylcarbamoyl transferase component Bud32